MKHVASAITIFGILFALSACQPTGTKPAVSLEEAKQITAEFEATEFKPPPRTVDDILDVIGALPPVPDNCLEIQQEREASIGEAARLLKSANSKMEYRLYASVLEIAARFELERGNFKRAIEMIRSGLGSLPDKGHSVSKIELRTQLVGIEADLGNISAARNHLAAIQNRWERIRRYSKSVYSKYSIQARRERLGAMAKGAIAQAEGRLIEAESHYRRVLEHYKYSEPNVRSVYLDLQRMVAELSANLLKQGRIAEAELESRRAIQAAFAYRFPHNPAQSAAPVAQFAMVLIEQDRVDDAEKLSRTAVALHEIDCSLPDSLAFVRARESLAQVLALKGDWSGVLEQIETARTALAEKPETFEHLFGESVEWALALIHTGRASEGLKQFEIALSRRTDRDGPESYSVAETRGVLAMAHAAIGNKRQAIEEFVAALPVLTSDPVHATSNAGRTTRSLRVNQMLDAYMELLADVQGTPLEAELGLVVADELFRVAGLNRSGTVQQALTAASERAAARDPVLADLVRREQDAAQELSVVLDSLITLSAAPEGQIEPSLQNQLRERAEALRVARIVIAEEIRREFPEFAEIVNPGTATVADVQAVMRLGEALIATYVSKTSTFVWAVPHRGKLAFARVAKGESDLAFDVSYLRGALDVKARTLGDIPPFDLEAAHELYRSILQPVEDGWRDAKSLYIVTDGPLGQLPFMLLPTDAPETNGDDELLFDRYRAVPWLARSHAVTVLPTAASLVTLRSRPPGATTRRAFVGFGDPWFRPEHATPEGSDAERAASFATRGDQSPLSLTIRLRNVPATRGVDSAELAQLPRLPDTGGEIRDIALALNADPAIDTFTGMEATETRVKSMDLSDRRVVAFATHGLMPGDLNGLTQPALALTSPDIAGGSDDGLLTMGEILGLELDADWVVLSACNTAAAQGAGAEAVSGLGRAFFYAGSRSLLASNWPVHSVSTKALTTDLFRRQAAGGSLTRAEALRQAMVAMIDNGVYAGADTGKPLFSYAHPIFWAPFSLIGDGS